LLAKTTHAQQLVSLYGTDAQLQLLRFLIESTDFKDGDGRGQKDQQRIQLLAQGIELLVFAFLAVLILPSESLQLITVDVTDFS
jgi:hypothetical protein